MKAGFVGLALLRSPGTGEAHVGVHVHMTSGNLEML